MGRYSDCPYKARVAGSSPVPPTKENGHLQDIVRAFFLVFWIIVQWIVQNDSGASWNGEIFTEQVGGQRYRIDSAQGDYCGSASPVREGNSVSFVPKMYRLSRSRHYLFFNSASSASTLAPVAVPPRSRQESSWPQRHDEPLRPFDFLDSKSLR